MKLIDLAKLDPRLKSDTELKTIRKLKLPESTKSKKVEEIYKSPGPMNRAKVLPEN